MMPLLSEFITARLAPVISAAQMQQFFVALEGPEGCDFREDDNGELTWKCAGGHDKSLAAAILAGMGVSEPGACLIFEEFDAHGGFCDCEILFNVYSRWSEEQDGFVP